VADGLPPTEGHPGQLFGFARALGGDAVKLYDFEVLKGDNIIAAERGVPLYNAKAAWPKLVAMARRLRQSGCRIRVKEQGETIILIGASAALRYSHFEFASAA
jgi:hypothetical protein